MDFAIGDYLRRYALFDLVIVLLPLRWLTGEIAFVAVAALLCFIHLLVHLDLDKRVGPFDALVMLMVLGCFTIAIVNAASTDYRSIYYGIVGAIALACARYLDRDHDHAFKVSRFLLISYYLIFLALGATTGFGAESIDGFFPNSSRNGVSAIAIFLQILYTTLFFVTRGSLPLATSLFTFAISVLCHGRAGLIVAGALLVVSLAHRVLRKPLLLLFLAAAAVVLVVALLAIPNSLVESALAGTNFYRRGFESLRSDMIRDYLAQIEPLSFFTGVNLSSIALIEGYNLNPHNSFLRGHSFFGIAYLVFIVILALSLVKGLLQRQFIIVFLLSLIIVRAFLDIVAFFDLLDFVPLLLMYMIAANVKPGGKRLQAP